MDEAKTILRKDGIPLAYRYGPGRDPTIVFLPGYRSDMLGGKSEAVASWAGANGFAHLRFDYSGCGESGGKFEDGTLAIWRDDAQQIIDAVATGSIILVGSSMGGWLALLLAEALQDRVVGLIGIAAAPDFTDWGFTADEKATLAQSGRLERPSAYDDSAMVTSRDFWESGQSLRMLTREIDMKCPVRLLQGQRDDAVPWRTALTIARQLCSDDVQVTLVKDGDHRLSRDQDIALLIETLDRMLNPA